MGKEHRNIAVPAFLIFGHKPAWLEDLMCLQFKADTGVVKPC